jgi:hypothetical protein
MLQQRAELLSTLSALSSTPLRKGIFGLSSVEPLVDGEF